MYNLNGGSVSNKVVKESVSRKLGVLIGNLKWEGKGLINTLTNAIISEETIIRIIETDQEIGQKITRHKKDHQRKYLQPVFAC